MKRQTVRILIGILLFGEAFTFAQSAPVNDDFEDRIVLTGSSVTFAGALQNATIQPGEPSAASLSGSFSIWPYGYYGQRQNASVWWSWAASLSGPVTLEVLNFSTNEFKLGAIDVWTGTNWPSGSNFVAGIALDIGRNPFLTFSATAGTTYLLRVVGTNYGDFTLKIIEANKPIIVIQPFSRTLSTNASVFFGVVAAGNPPFSPPFSYQWRFNGLDLPGETFPILGMDHLTTNQSGGYSVMVSNTVGGTLSDTAILNVTEAIIPPLLTSVGASNGQFRFGILGDLDGLHRIQSSTNLADWSEEESFPKQFIYYDGGSFRARNGVVYGNSNLFFVPQSWQHNFYRTTGYVPVLAACINNLAEIRFAKEIWSLESKNTGYSVPTPSEIGPYLKNGGLVCPLAGSNGTFQSSYLIDRCAANPRCMISPAHILEEPEY
jgi:hypothetical protein